MRRWLIRLAKWGGCSLLVLAGLWFLYTLEDNWRGARAWHQTLADLKARGEPTSFAELIPPRVPDAQNLAALPLFALGDDPEVPGGKSLPRLKAMLDKIDLYKVAIRPLIFVGDVQPDLKSVIAYLNVESKKRLGHTSDPLTEWDELMPEYKELREAAATRPVCRFEQDYTTQPPEKRNSAYLWFSLSLGKLPNIHAQLAGELERLDVALTDLRLSSQLISGDSREPKLIWGLIAEAITAMNTHTVCRLLQRPGFTDDQLAEIQADFEPLDFLSNAQLSLRGETFALINDYGDEPLSKFFHAFYDQTWKPAESKLWTIETFSRIDSWLSPQGWSDLAKVDRVKWSFALARCFDPARHRLEIAQLKLRLVPTPLRYNLSWRNLEGQNYQRNTGNAFIRWAVSQFRIDATIILCALERYRLAHGHYPPKLAEADSLAPHGLPHDPLTGEAYKYQLQPDGTYKFYSIGWNQTDEGGKAVFKSGTQKGLDYKQGDWLWPEPKR